MAHPLIAPARIREIFADGAGSGVVELRCISGQTVVTRAQAKSPLKLLNPRSGGSSAWIFSSTYGGGLVAGDEIALNANVGERCACLLGTQSATKVYRSPEHLAARQNLSVSLAEDATCIIAPHAVTCFASARFVQRQRIEMAAGASLVLVDWFTSGRHARGERWSFDRYDSRTDVYMGSQHVFRDALLLSQADGPIDSPHRTGPFNCFAYVLVLGRAFAAPVKERLQKVERQPIPATPDPALIFAASPLNEGAIFRAAGMGSEIVGRWLLEQLDFVSETLGSDRWARSLG